jgi:hypothetical protein
MIEIPKQKSVVVKRDPKVTILYSQPKVGKTTLLSTLPNNLILDLENGSDYVECMAMKIIGITAPDNEDSNKKEKRLTIDKMYYLNEAGLAIMKEGRPYDFITVDTVTILEDLVLSLANEKYRNSPMGGNWGKLPNGLIDPNADVKTLARGAGYYYLRLAFEETLTKIKKLANHIILIGHLRNSITEKNGDEVISKDLSLTGKIREITCADSDAIGYVYRGSESELLINFKGSEEILCGARPPHLKGQIIKIADYDKESNQLINIDWSLIFPDTIK